MTRSAPLAHWTARSDWRRIDFLSDLHLKDPASATWRAWEVHLEHTPADAIVILGDLFETWVGDDAVQEPGMEQAAADVLRRTANRKTVAFMPGNRDFLLGTLGLLDDCGVIRLDDPCVLTAFGARWALSHGDAACLDDLDYQAFRSQVRSPVWQSQFLQLPLDQRRRFAAQARDASKAHQQMATQPGSDLDATAVDTLLSHAGATTLIHGHTHRPAVHQLSATRTRWVLSDWDLDAAPPRADIVALSSTGLHRESPVGSSTLA